MTVPTLKMRAIPQYPVRVVGIGGITTSYANGVLTISSGTTASVPDNSITNALLRDSIANSVIGRAANSTGDPGDIQAANDHQVLRRSGTVLGFGAIDISQSAAVTGTLPATSGGTGTATLGGTTQLLYTSATNTLAAFPTTADAFLTSTAGSVPQWSTTLPAAIASGITQVGTITSGTWNGSVITPAFGGTGLSSYAAGDIIAATGATTLARVPSTTGVLQASASGGTPFYGGTPSLGTVLVGNGVAWTHLAAGTAGQVLTSAGSSAVVAWDDLGAEALSGLPYIWLTTSAVADPGLGKVNTNNASPGSAFTLSISQTDTLGRAVTGLIRSACQSLSGVRGQLWFFDLAAPQNWLAFDVIERPGTGAAMFDHSGWSEIQITLREQGGTLANNTEVVLQIMRTGDAGSAGAPGTAGATGPIGPSASLEYTFDTGTSGDPGSGEFLFNAALGPGVLSINISETAAGGGNVAAWLDEFDSSTTVGDKGSLTIIQKSDVSKFAVFKVNSTLTDAGTYQTVPVTFQAGAGPLTGLCTIRFDRTGNAGTSGAGTGDVIGPATATVLSDFVLWDSTDGTVVKDGGTFTAATIPFVPAGTIAATNVQAAIVEVNNEKQPLDATLTGIAGVTTSADQVIYATGADAFAVTGFTSTGRAIAGAVDAAAARSTLGLAAIASTGSAADLSAGTVPAARMPAHTGDVTSTVGTVALTIPNDTVTYAKMQNVSATSRFLGRITASAGDVEELTAANARTILALTSTDVGLGNVVNVDTTNAANITSGILPDARRDVGINAVTATAYTFILTDRHKLVTFNAGASAVIVDVPLNSSVAFPVGTKIDVARLGAGTVRIRPVGGGVTLNSASGNQFLAAQYAGASLIQTSLNNWLLVGNLSAT